MLRITFAIALLARAAAAASHADLSLDLQLPAKLPTPQPVLYGSVRNYGPDPAENVVVIATTSNGHRFELPLGTVSSPLGQPFTLTFPKEDAAFDIDVRVTTTTPDSDNVNDAVSGPVQVTSAAKLSFYFNYPYADPGQPVVYDLRVRNNGPTDARPRTSPVRPTRVRTCGEPMP